MLLELIPTYKLAYQQMKACPSSCDNTLSTVSTSKTHHLVRLYYVAYKYLKTRTNNNYAATKWFDRNDYFLQKEFTVSVHSVNIISKLV